jgi:hypothetical protein
MRVGTKSLLFGVHQVFLHPFFVARAWKACHGSYPRQLPVWMAIVCHDWGYFGCPEMDGPEGKQHPRLGAKLIGKLFGPEWEAFALYHSRSLAHLDDREPSALCAPDKLSFAYYPEWLYLLLARASGELQEYLRNADSPAGRRVGIDASTPQTWFRSTRAYMLRVVSDLQAGADAGVPAEMMREEAS